MKYVRGGEAVVESVGSKLRRCSVAVVSATVLLASGLSAQTSIYSTYPSVSPAGGPFIFDLGPPNAYWEASEFVFNGPTGSTLASVLFEGSNAFQTAANILTVSFLQGATIGTASVLDSWQLQGSTTPTGDATYVLTSSLQPTLTNGDTYWVELSSPFYAWVWDNSATGDMGRASSTDLGATWTPSADYDVYGAPTYEVYANEAPAPNVTPEPATMALLATGLAVIAGAGVRRRRV